MQKRIIFIGITFVLLVLVACRPKNIQSEIAEAFCACFEPMTELYQQMEEKSGDEMTEELKALMKTLEEAALNSESCVEEIESTFGDAVGEQEEEIKVEMKRICPKVIATLEEIDADYE